MLVVVSLLSFKYTAMLKVCHSGGRVAVGFQGAVGRRGCAIVAERMFHRLCFAKWSDFFKVAQADWRGRASRGEPAPFICPVAVFIAILS